MWNQVQNDCGHTARAQGPFPLDGLGGKAVRRDMDQIISAPLVSGDLVFCYVARGFNLTLTATEIESGEQAWERPVKVYSSGYRGTGALRESSLYCLDELGLAIVDMRSGELLARMKNSDEWLATSPPTLNEERIFFHDHAGRLWAADADTLDSRWIVRRRSMISYAPPAVSEKVVIAQWIKAGLSCVAGLDVETGECMWELERSDLIRGTCTLHGGRAFMPVSQEDAILALDAETGAVLWKHSVETWLERQYLDHLGFCVADQKLLHGMSPSFYEALDQATGEVVWRFKTESPCPYHPIAGPGWVVFVARDGTVTWLSTDNGQMLARFSAGEEIFLAPAMTDRGLFVVSKAGTIWCIS